MNTDLHGFYGFYYAGGRVEAEGEVFTSHGLSASHQDADKGIGVGRAAELEQHTISHQDINTR